MPNCPGCERRVAYDDLRRHVNECLDVSPGDDAARVTIESLDDRVTDVEGRLLRRIARIETELDVEGTSPRTNDTSIKDRRPPQ